MKKFHQETSTTHNHLQQSSRLQNEHTEIISLPVYKWQTIKKPGKQYLYNSLKKILVKDLYNKNFKAFKKNTKDTRKYKGLPCSWINKVNIVKMAILPKAIYRLSRVPIKISRQLFTEIERTILEIHTQTESLKQPWIIIIIITDGAITIPNLKLYYRSTVIKKTHHGGAGEITQGLRALVALPRGPGFNTQHPHGTSQLSVTTLPGDLTPSHRQTDRQAKHHCT